MQNTEIEISIIIINYNGKHFLRECLNSIVQYVDVSYETIIVDNASSDGSVKYIKDNFPYVKLIENSKNVGFGKGNNIGAKYAVGNFLLLLNNDTRLLSPVSSLVAYMRIHKKTGIVGCRLLNSDGSIQYSIGYYHTPFRLITGWLLPKSFKKLSCCQLYEKRNDFYNRSHAEVEWITGAFMLIRRETWDTLEGMDQAFFMYLEDVDFCQRAYKHGWKTAYIHDVVVLHHEGGTGTWRSKNAFLHTMDSCHVYIMKHYGKISWFVVKFLLAMIMSFRGVANYVLSIWCVKKHEHNIIKGDIYLAAAARLLFPVLSKIHSGVK